MRLQADLNEAARLAALEAERLFQESLRVSSVKADDKRGFALFLFVLSSSIWLPTVAAAPPVAALIAAPVIACGFIDFFSKDPAALGNAYMGAYAVIEVLHFLYDLDPFMFADYPNNFDNNVIGAGPALPVLPAPLGLPPLDLHIAINDAAIGG